MRCGPRASGAGCSSIAGAPADRLKVSQVVMASSGAQARKFVFELIQKPDGWYVVGISAIGPFERREPAEQLARELVRALNADGGDAHLVTP